MPKFAVYYVPPEDSEFYRLGTRILGYDVRNRQSEDNPTPALKKAQALDEASYYTFALGEMSYNSLSQGVREGKIYELPFAVDRDIWYKHSNSERIDFDLPEDKFLFVNHAGIDSYRKGQRFIVPQDYWDIIGKKLEKFSNNFGILLKGYYHKLFYRFYSRDRNTYNNTFHKTNFSLCVRFFLYIVKSSITIIFYNFVWFT